MSNVSLEKKIIDETKNLSTETLMEILDFIQFLKIKNQRPKNQDSYISKVSDELSAKEQYSLKHLEDEFQNYREKYPHE